MDRIVIACVILTTIIASVSLIKKNTERELRRGRNENYNENEEGERGRGRGRNKENITK